MSAAVFAPSGGGGGGGGARAPRAAAAPVALLDAAVVAALHAHIDELAARTLRAQRRALGAHAMACALSRLRSRRAARAFHVWRGQVRDRDRACACVRPAARASGYRVRAGAARCGLCAPLLTRAPRAAQTSAKVSRCVCARVFCVCGACAACRRVGNGGA